MTLPAIPESAIKHDSIEEMKEGQIGYTMPWAIVIQPDNTGTINRRYPVSDKPHGTQDLKIKRVSGGVEVWITNPHRWDKNKRFSRVWADMPILEWHLEE